MKKSNLCFILLILLIGIFLFLNRSTVKSAAVKLLGTTPRIYIPKKSMYALDKDYKYVQKTSDFTPNNRQEVMNILYTIFDNGYESFTFYCPSEYKSCVDAVEDITNDQTIITNIGNFVHPFNNFTSIKVSTDALGEVKINVNKMYSSDDINRINGEMDKIINSLDPSLSLDEKILKVHDALIEKAEYDLKNDDKFGSAIDIFDKGKTKCSGYSDAFAIALNRLNVQNIKVASVNHVWNGIFINGKWIHTDLTWDDPIPANGIIVSDLMKHKFYMIDTNTLLSYDTKEHNFDKNVYPEFK